jgi:3',5'-cyclic AMP phosphodiesterase CpdA
MRTVIHLSDLHFGRVRDALVGPLLDTVGKLAPDVIAVSGDLTQRARKRQFQAARGFLDSLPGPQIIVPGNHDVPLYNLFARFRSLGGYRRHIGDDLEPFYVDAEIAVLGINTARALTFKGGRINQQQIARIKERLGGLADTVTKVIVTHHPFDLPENYAEAALVGRARLAIKSLSDCKLDLFLAGHFHRSVAAPTTFRYAVNGYSGLIVQAGTAISSRTRGEANAFNVIRIDLPNISIERFEWRPERGTFVVSATDHFRRAAGGWREIPSESQDDFSRTR